MQGKEKNPEKLPVRRIISNYFYLLCYAFEKDASLVLFIFVAFILGGVGYACMDTIFIRVFINYLSDNQNRFQDTVVLVAVPTIGIALLMAK